jgi:hypothetical protein
LHESLWNSRIPRIAGREYMPASVKVTVKDIAIATFTNSLDSWNSQKAN